MSYMLKSPGFTTGVASFPFVEIRKLCVVGRQPGSHHLQSDFIYPAFRFRVHIILKTTTIQQKFFFFFFFSHIKEV